MFRYIWALSALISLCQSRTASFATKEPYCNGKWTAFYDRDDPSGSYDYESLYNIQIENPQDKICANPIGVDARLLNGLHYSTSGEVVTVSPSVGLICKNSDQKDKRCEDYKVRFCCPKEEVIPECPEGSWTGWFDRDNPSGHGDYELLSDLQTEYPGKICPSPTAVHARLTNGEPYTSGNNIVTIGAAIGIYCKNSDQPEGRKCADYEVRFCCHGAATCPNKEDWTPWFDRDDPSGHYDWEHLSAIQAEYPGVCASPVAVEAQLTNGAPYTSGGDVVSIGPLIGLTCKNDDQEDKRCNDYKVRFCCPAVPSPCRKEDWTPWYDRDNPSGSADYEALSILQSENPGKICQQPTGVDVQTVDGAPYTSTGDILSIGPLIGVVCYNSDQDDKRCADYKVRFCCSKDQQEPPTCPEGAWTPYFDRDDPSGNGDYELLSHLQIENPGKICASPSAADARLKNGGPWTSGGDVGYLSPNGFYCNNADQADGKCNDYEVRFCCFGASTCPPKSWTQWFDRDDPSGYWDWEGLTSIQNENPGKVCAYPTAVDAQLTNGAPYTSGQDVVSIGPSIGLLCENDAQNDKRCNDYKVRFCCATADETPFCPANKWTQWMDRDNPSGSGDWETLESLQTAYPGTICKNPTAIDAQLTSGAPYTDGGNTLTLSASQGLICRNSPDNVCKDYQVRFCCPEDEDQEVRDPPREALERQRTEKEFVRDEAFIRA